VLRVAVTGASGYMGAELLRLLSVHPKVRVTAVTSERLAGERLDKSYPHLRGLSDLVFQEISAERLAAEQDVDRGAVALARDVPEGLLEPAHRAPEVHRPALGREVVVGPVHEVGDLRGVAADEIAAEGLHQGDDARVAVGLRVALAPAVRAAVGLDLHEAQVLAPAEIGEARDHTAHEHRLHRSAAIVPESGGPTRA